jgi:hypothetical protein
LKKVKTEKDAGPGVIPRSAKEKEETKAKATAHPLMMRPKEKKMPNTCRLSACIVLYGR